LVVIKFIFQVKQNETNLQKLLNNQSSVVLERKIKINFLDETFEKNLIKQVYQKSSSIL